MWKMGDGARTAEGDSWQDDCISLRKKDRNVGLNYGCGNGDGDMQVMEIQM